MTHPGNKENSDARKESKPIQFHKEPVEKNDKRLLKYEEEHFVDSTRPVWNYSQIPEFSSRTYNG